MKKILNFFLLGAAVFFVLGCKVERPVFIGKETATGITSLSAKFNSGDLAADPNAVFSINVTDRNVKEIIIPIPYFYPKDTDNRLIEEDIKKMRVQAAVESGVSINPPLGLMDLTKDNPVEVFLPNGETLNYVIKGRIEKLRECELEELSLTDNEGYDYDCLIDHEALTVKAIEPLKKVLAQCKVKYKVSPHSVLTSPDVSKVMDWKTGDKITVLAHDETTKKEYTFSIEVPEKTEYGMRLGSEFNKWVKFYKLDYNITNNKPITRLAILGDNLIVSTGEKIVVVDRFKGAKIKDVAIPGGLIVHSLTNDDAGHIIFAANTPHNQVLTIYMLDETGLMADNIVPVELFKTNTHANIQGANIGNFRVKGDVTKDAVVAGVCGPVIPGYYVAWEIKNGAPAIIAEGLAKGVFGKVAGPNQYWYPEAGAVMPAGTSFADGMFYIGYDGARNVFYAPEIIMNATWKEVVKTGNAGNENFNCLDIIEFNGAKYLAFLAGAHFNYSVSPLLNLYDCSNLDAMQNAGVLKARPQNRGDFTGIGASSDIKMQVAKYGYKMHIYYTDGNYDLVGCYEVDCIKK